MGTNRCILVRGWYFGFSGPYWKYLTIKEQGSLQLPNIKRYRAT